MWKRVISISIFLTLLVLGAGCQLDFTGPTASAKIFRENENNGEVWKSRQSGVFSNNSLPMVGSRNSN